MKKTLRMLRLAALFALAGAAGFYFSGSPHFRQLLKPEGWDAARENRELLLHLKQHYSLNAEELRELFSEGRIDQFLNTRDPYSDFLTPEEFRSFERGTNQKYEGIGVQIARLETGVTVTKVFADSPAQKAGVLPGDRILLVDGVSVEGLSISRVVEHITGPPGTSVSLSVFRDLDQSELTLVPVRSDIEYPSLSRAEMLQGDIGLIRVEEFGRRTSGEFGQALARLEEDGMRGLIIDLRNNPGGMLTAAVDVAGHFLDRGEVVLELRGIQRRENEIYRARTPSRPVEYPIVVLLNRGSASASEIVGGALKAAGKARILGERSYGKGSIQSIFALSNGEGLKITTARYFFSDGSTIEDGVGLEPDHSVILSREELYRLRLYEFHREILDGERFKERFGFAPIEDRQIEEALRMLQVGRVADPGL